MLLHILAICSELKKIIKISYPKLFALYKLFTIQYFDDMILLKVDRHAESCIIIYDLL